MESSHHDLHDKLLKLRDKLITLNLAEDAMLVEKAARELNLVTVERDKLKHDWKERTKS